MTREVLARDGGWSPASYPETRPPHNPRSEGGLLAPTMGPCEPTASLDALGNILFTNALDITIGTF